MPKVTALVVSYNHERFIYDCLASIEEQQFEDIEVICVDDGSTDASAQIARAFDGLDMRVYEKSNGGPSDAFNYGIERASGDILCMISADDIMLPGSIAARVDILEKGDAEIVCGLPTWIGADGRSLFPSEYPDIFAPFEMSPEALFTELFFVGNFICAPTIAMRRSCHHEIGTFDRRFVQLQDYDYWLRATALGKRFHCTDAPLVGYRWHGGNLSSSNSERSDLEFDQVRENIMHNADRAFLSKVLNGPQDAIFSQDLLRDEIVALLMVMHPKPGVSNLGRARLGDLMKTDDRKVALRQAFLV